MSLISSRQYDILLSECSLIIMKSIKTPNHPDYHWSTLWPLEVWVRGLYNSWWFCVHKLSTFIYLSMFFTVSQLGGLRKPITATLMQNVELWSQKAHLRRIFHSSPVLTSGRVKHPYCWREGVQSSSNSNHRQPNLFHGKRAPQLVISTNSNSNHRKILFYVIWI